MESKNEIFSQRLIEAVLWNIVLQTAIAVILVFLIQTNLLHPVVWITSTFQDIMAWKMLLNILLLALVSFFQAYIYGSYYMTPVPKYFSRFSMFLNLFTIQNMTFTVLYALSGYFTMGLYSSLAKSNYNMLRKSCDNHANQCLMEPSLFLQLGGMWMGLYYFIKVHLFGSTTLLFPHVYQDKFQQIKLAASNILSKGFSDSVVPVFYYCILYYIWGNKPRVVVMDVYGLYLEDPPLDNLFNLMMSGIWIGLWFYSSLFFTSVCTMKTIFNIILTEPIKFPIESETSLTLQNALAQKYQFNGCLAAHDLRTLSMTDQVRRAQVFTLSQPGGHPRNWHGILEKSLIIIKDFSTELDHINEIKPVEMQPRKQINLTPPKYIPLNMRNMAQSPQLFELKDHNKNDLQDTFSDMVKTECTNYLNKLSQKPVISYFFGELTDTKLKYLLTQAQPVMWTCEGLAFVVAASLKEDKYGVVQNDLPQIIGALLNLKQNLDKLTKLGLVPRKQILNDAFAIKMKTALNSAVKRSIYKIVNTFTKYMHEIPLEPEQQIAIQPFLFCKEA